MTAAVTTIYNRIVELIGSDVVAVHAMSLPPDAAFPCAVYAQIYGGDGVAVSGGADDTYRLRYQIDVYHSVFADLLAIRATLLSGFQRFAGGEIIDTRIDLDIPYVADDLDQGLPNLYRHIIDLSFEVKRSSA